MNKTDKINQVSMPVLYLLVMAIVSVVIISTVNALTPNPSAPKYEESEDANTLEQEPVISDQVHLKIHSRDLNSQVIREKKSLPVYNGMNIYSEDKIIQASEDELYLLSENGILLMLENGSELKIKDLTEDSINLQDTTGRFWIRIEKNSDYRVILQNIDFTARNTLLMIEDSKLNVIEGQVNISGKEVGTEESVDMISSGVNQSSIINDKRYLYLLCLDETLVTENVLQQPFTQALESVTKILNESTKCSAILGVSTSNNQNQALETYQYIKPKVTVKPLPTIIPTKLEKAELLFAYDDDKAFCKWDLSGELKETQQLSFSLWQYNEGVNDTTLIDWTAVDSKSREVELILAPDLSFTNQQPYYCIVQIVSAESQQSVKSDDTYYDISRGHMTITEPSGYFRGEIEGDGRVYDMDINNVKIQYSIKLTQSGVPGSGRYCLGNDNWGTMETWLEAPIIVKTIHNLFLFKDNTVSCVYASNYEQALLQVKMYNKLTGKLISETAFPVVLN